jgi:uncharacterized protein YjaG (DUF416 family)
MIKEKIHSLFEEVKTFSFEQQKRWLADILQEIAAYYQAFSEENQFGDPRFFDRVLAMIQLSKPECAQLQSLKQELEKEGMIPDTEDYGTIGASLSINSCVIADYILQFLETGEEDLLNNIIESHFEMAEMLYGQDLEANLRMVAWEAYLCAKPDFKHFVAQQDEKIRQIRLLA